MTDPVATPACPGCPFCATLSHSDCVFCRIVAGDSPAQFVALAPKHVAFVPINPATPGHALFIPRDHVPSAASDGKVAGEVINAAATWAARRFGDFNLITSVGARATQTVFHFHVHVVPRGVEDGLPSHWPWLNL